MSCTCVKNKKFIPGYSSPLCPQCRADLELGRAVRAMDPMTSLARNADETWTVSKFGIVENEDAEDEWTGDTPEEALKEVGK